VRESHEEYANLLRWWQTSQFFIKYSVVVGTCVQVSHLIFKLGRRICSCRIGPMDAQGGRIIVKITESDNMHHWWEIHGGGSEHGSF